MNRVPFSELKEIFEKWTFNESGKQLCEQAIVKGKEYFEYFYK